MKAQLLRAAGEVWREIEVADPPQQRLTVPEMPEAVGVSADWSAEIPSRDNDHVFDLQGVTDGVARYVEISQREASKAPSPEKQTR